MLARAGRECVTDVTGQSSVGLWVAARTRGLSGVYVLYVSHRVDAGMQHRGLHRRQAVHAGVMTHVTAVRHHHRRMRVSR